MKKDKEKASRIASLTLTFSAITGSIITLITILFSEYIATNTLKAPELKNEFILAAFVLWFCAYNGAQIGIMNGLKRFKEVAKIQIINCLICLPLYIIGAFLGVFWSVMAFAVSNLLLCLQTGYAIGKAEKMGLLTINYINGWKEWKILYHYSLPATLAGIMIMPVKWISEIILVNNSGFSAMGTFAAVLTLHRIVRNTTNTMTYPFISFMSAKSNDRTLNNLNILAPWFISTIICLPFVAFPEIGGWMFGKEYQGTEFDKTFIFVLIYTLIIIYKQLTSRIFAVKNKQWLEFTSNFIWGIVLLITFYILKEKATIGLAISYCIAYAFVIIIMVPVCIKNKWLSTELLFSRWALLIWGLIAILIYFSYIQIHFTIRIFISIVFTTIILYSFSKLFKAVK